MKSTAIPLSGMKSRAWYVAPTVLNGIVSIASVPILILSVGSTVWAEIALGQAIGLLGSVFVGLGWPVVGPALMARASADAQYRDYVLSVWARLGLAVAVTVLTVLLFQVLSLDRSVLFWTAIASNLLGCTSSWYFLGIDDPKGLFWRDAFIRSAGTFLGVIGVVVSARGELFAGGLALGIVASMVFTYQKVRARRETTLSRPTAGEVLRSIRSQGKGFTVNALFVALSSMALPLAAVVGGQVFVVFAILDKVQKQLTTVALPLTQLITGRMAGDLGRGEDALETAGRMFRSIIVSAAALVILMVPVGPLAVEVMSVGSVGLHVSQTVLLAFVVGLAFVAQCLPIAVLAPVGKLRYAIYGMSLAIIVGIPGLLWSAAEGGITALMLSLCFIYALPIISGTIGLYLARARKMPRLAL